MGVAPTLGIAMKRRILASCVAWMVALSFAAPAFAQQRFAIIIAGATGGEEYAAQYTAWMNDLVQTLTGRLAFEASRVTVLSETDETVKAASAENVRRTIGSIRQTMKRDDLLFILLIGHGTFDGTDAKFNLVGPDLESSEWASLLEPLPGLLVVVNTTAGSFPFLEKLSGSRRVVITATDSIAQRFDTVFPEYFIKSFLNEASDLDKNGRISLWEAFAFASAGVRRHYQQRGLLATERSLLDDDGDGVGKAVADKGADGGYASRVYLDENLPGAAPTDEELLKLLQRKSLVEAELDELKIRRTFLPAEEYAREFERIIIELAKVSRDIRLRAKS
jgi:hypothetical protein